MAKKYKCIFFDLDHTLWDYEANAKEALSDLYESFGLKTKGISSSADLYAQFRTVNLALWDKFDRQEISQEYLRTERFKQILEFFSAYDEKLSNEISEVYLAACPKKTNLVPYAIDMLEYLSKNYRMTIVTNGFDEIQKTKIASVKLEKYFDHIITSQKAGHRKPSEKIFEYAMKLNDIQCCDAIMIGDNLLTDIAGAKNASIDTIFFNPERVAHNETVSHEISCLSELKNIL